MEDTTILGESTLSKKEQQQKVVYSVLEYLQQTKGEGFDEDALESIEVATQCLSNAFGVSLENQEQKKYSLAPHDLPSILNLGQTGRQKIEQAVEQLHKKQPPTADANDIELKFYQYLQALKKRGVFNGITPGSAEYETTYSRARQKFFDKFQTSSAEVKVKEEPTSETQPQKSPSSPVVTSSTTPMATDDNVHQAEQFKNQGNQMLSSKQYSKAVEYYNKAIELNPTNAIYYSNRAAAYSHMGMHDKAVEDCKLSISLNPNYSKAYGRLGLAYFSMGKYAEAVEEYKKGLKLEPNSASLKESLAAAEKKLHPNKPASTATPSPQSPPSTIPNVNDMFNNPEVMNTLGGMFGNQGGGIASILNNPMFQSMAQQMMSNPQMMNMASSLMQNPDAINNMMGSLGGMMGQFGDTSTSEDQNEEKDQTQPDL